MRKLLLLLILPFISQAQTIWTGPMTTFTKSNDADWTLEANQDRITDNVWITRANNQSIFNISDNTDTSSGNCSGSSPLDTEWAFGTIADGINTLTFGTFLGTSFANCAPPSVVNQNAVLHLITDDIYIDIKFLFWTSGGNGGGFSYMRSTPEGSGDAGILLNGVVSAESNQIKNVAEPTDAQDAATKNYVDNAGIQGPQGIQGVAGADGTNGSDGADGADGKGIASTTDNNDGTFTITYTDNTTFTTSDFTGPTGATGPQGATGAAGTNGTNGSDGADGADGKGIASTTDNNDGTFTITYTDNTTFTTSDFTGPSGNDGSDGVSILTELTDVITTGQGSILIGGASSSASYNTAFGYNSLDATSSQKNSAFGYNSLTNSTSGASNSAFGQDSGKNISTGSYNTAIGQKSSVDLSSGDYNVSLGFNAGDNITSNSNNTFIGSNTVGSNTTNATVLGYGVTSQGSNTVTLGNSDVTDVYLAQDSGATVHVNQLNLDGTSVTATAAELNFVDGVTSNIQTQLDSKLSSLTAGDGITLSGSQISTDVKVAKFNWSNNYDNLSNSTENYIPWDTTVFNSNSSVFQLTNSGSTGTDCARILINETGYYELKALVFLYDMYNNVDVKVSVAKSSGSTGTMSLIELIFDGKFSETTSDRTLNSSTILSLSSGEYISISVNPSANGPYPSSSSNGKTTLTLTKL